MNPNERVFPGWPAAACVLVLVLAGCAGGVLARETTGEKFRRVLAAIDAGCRENKMGPYLDPSDPEYRNKLRGTDCDILKLEPRDWRTEKMVTTEGQHYPIPERWLSTPEGRFAHSIKLPVPLDKPKNVYRSGMDAKEYFEALCREEAGEFVFERAKGVEGVVQDRPSPLYPRGYSGIVFFAMEAKPLLGGSPGGYLVGTSRGRYSYLDVRLREDERSGQWTYRRYIDLDAASPLGTRSLAAKSTALLPEPLVREELTDGSKATHAFTFRGIRRPNDWENGIQGEELIIYQVVPAIVLAVKRRYSRFDPEGVRLDQRAARAVPCPSVLGTWDREDPFILEVLRPRSTN